MDFKPELDYQPNLFTKFFEVLQGFQNLVGMIDAISQYLQGRKKTLQENRSNVNKSYSVN